MSPRKPAVADEAVVEAQPLEGEAEVHRLALVHILTAEFQGLDPADFEDIGDDVVERASPETLRSMLLDVEPTRGRSSIGYRPAELNGRWLRMAVTPQEFGLFSRHIEMLAKTAINGVLVDRDRKLQDETGNKAAKARSEEDIRAANRAGVRQVASKEEAMTKYLKSNIEEKLAIIDRFIEMTTNPNLTRGTQASIRERFETLRLYIFGDMLDAIANQAKWTPELTERAARILQKRLYMEPDRKKRQQNFKDMLALAKDYYGHKRALVLGRIAESEKYFRDNPEAVQDVIDTDAARQSA